MCTNANYANTLLFSVPETMVQSYGHYKHTSTFKIKHSGETFSLPHYNFDVKNYFHLYISYLKMLMGTTSDISIYHMNDYKESLNLLQLETMNIDDNTTINKFIYKQFNSNIYAYYIEIKDTTQYDIGRSLITNTTFQGECNICYQTTSLKHYYSCDLKDKNNHHGICGSCYISWQSSNPNNNCPLCRSHKNTDK